jgi:hypothetical protein
VIPASASWYVEREVRNKYPSAGDVSASVKAFPAVLILFKDYSSLEVETGNITLKGIRFDSIRLFSHRWPDAAYRAVIEQGEVVRFLTPADPRIRNPAIDFSKGAVTISCDLVVGSGYAVRAGGSLEAKGGSYAYFRPDIIEFADPGAAGALPREYIEEILVQNPVFTVTEDLPLTIESISAGEGNMTVTGELNLEEALGLDI